MKNLKTSITYLKWQLVSALKNPVFYITGLIFLIFLSLNFYIRQRFFTGYGSTDLILFFSAVPYISILAIPALCYKRSDSIYNDFIPLKNITKLLIRFTSILILYIIYILLLIPSVLLINLFGDVDGGQFFTSILGLILYGGAVIAVTLFINELIDSPVLSFVIAAIVLAVINSAHLFTTFVNFNNFFSSLFKSFSFTWHFDAAGKGILDSRDIIWMLSSTALFIILANLVKEKKLNKQYDFQHKSFITALILICVLVLMNGNRWYFRADLSQTKTYSLSSYSKKLIEKIEAPLKITYYRSNSLSKIYPQVRDVSDYLITYAGQSSKINFVIVDPEKEDKVSTLLENYGITSQPFVNARKNSTEYTNVYSAIVVEYNGNFEVIPYLLSTETLEYDLDGRINHLLTGITRVVNVIIGNDASLNDDYSYVIPWLNSQGFVCNALYTVDPSFVYQLEQCSGPLFVIGDSVMNVEAAAAIERYILQNKGNVLFNVSPYSVNITGDWSVSKNIQTNIVDMLENWGIEFSDSITADLSCLRITMSSQESDENTQSSIYTRVLNYPLWLNILSQNNAKLGVTLSWVPELKLSRNAEPYLYTTKSSWAYKINEEVPSRLIESNPFIIEEQGYKSDNTSRIIAAEINGPLTGLYNSYTTEKAQIIVIPDQYFVSTLMASLTGESKNFYFMTNTLLRLNGEIELAEMQNKASKDTTLFKITDEAELNSKQNLTYTIAFGLIPLILVLAGILIYLLQLGKMKNVKEKYSK